MKVVKIKGRIISEEKETILNYDYVNKMWSMYSVVSTHYNKALRQGWTPTVRYEYEDGTTAGYCLEAPGHSVTIRSVEKKKMSEKQMCNLQSDDEE